MKRIGRQKRRNIQKYLEEVHECQCRHSNGITGVQIDTNKMIKCISG